MVIKFTLHWPVRQKSNIGPCASASKTKDLCLLIAEMKANHVEDLSVTASIIQYLNIRQTVKTYSSKTEDTGEDRERVY